MKTRSVTHATFTLERTYNAAPEKVFQAFADPKKKKQWFGNDPGFETFSDEHDFRVGHGDYNKGRWQQHGIVSEFRTFYQDIVPNERIIYSYDMSHNDERISVSLTSIELVPAGKGTKLTFVEHGAYLDGHDNPKQRQDGTAWILDNLGKFVENQ